MKSRPLFPSLLLIAAFLPLITTLPAQSSSPASQSVPATQGWPRTFTANGTAFTVYQPQATSLENGILKFRMAVSATPQGGAQPTFGTVKLSAITTSNPDGVTVALNDVAVVGSTFPSAADQATSYAQAVATQAAQWGASVSMQAIQANLAVTAAESKKPKSVAVQNPVPQIILSQTPALLVLVDGQPALRSVQGTSLLRVINTQALIAMDQSSGTYYLRVNGAWVQSATINGPWSASSNPPAGLDSLLQQATASGNVQLYDPQQGTAPATPDIHVSTVPAELIVTEGAPAFQQVSGTQLLHATNTVSSLFMNIANQSYYVAISGRWFSAANLNGPWQFVPANQLPPDFANIPENAPAGSVLASVAGTSQAQEAAIASSVPQMARITRSAGASVSYDGDPKFQKIEGTGLSYAVNTATPVVLVSPGNYFAVINGVWFKAPSPTGPWKVADKVPASIYTIPLSCPIYYATNVYIYGSTPEYVTAGYTPGYYGTCLSPDGVVVFGTGYNYVPYIGSGVWIAPPLTYGFGAGIACGLATGFAFGVLADHGWGCSPGWGPWGAGWGGNTYNFNRNWGNVNAVQNNVYNRWGNNNISNVNRQQLRQDRQTFDQNHPQAASDMNRDAQNFKADHPDAGQDLRNDTRDGSLSRDNLTRDSSRLRGNDVFAGKDGNAYRSAADGNWHRHDSSGWSNINRGGMNQDLGRDLDNQRFARNEGTIRSSGFSGGGSRDFGGGGFRGGSVSGGFRGGGFRR
jgi:hypothetical protein